MTRFNSQHYIWTIAVVLSVVASVTLCHPLSAKSNFNVKMEDGHASKKSVSASSNFEMPNTAERKSASLKGRSTKFVSLDVGIDALGIAKYISGSISASQNRDAFVKNLAYTAFYNAGSRYNVMVFNLNVDHSQSFHGVKMYASANYHGIIFGIWVFEGGRFHNKGDGGYINWAFVGWFDRDHGVVDFH